MHSIKEKIRSVEMKSAQNDMTVGNPMKIIFGFTLPIFIGNVFQQFYNMADAVIVGKFVGNKALAAVGSTGTIMFAPCSQYDILFILCRGNDGWFYCPHGAEIRSR